MKIEELKNLSMKKIREIYREYLESQNLSSNTIQTSCTDAFYLLRNDSNLDFWNMIGRADYEKIAFEHLKITLSQNSKGNVDSNINSYMAHIRRFKRFIDGDVKIIRSISESQKTITYQKSSLKSKRGDVPQPSDEEVEKYLYIWNQLENYHLQEIALNKLFFELCPNNNDISDILLKASTLNDFYSTNIFSIFPVAKNIFDLDIDKRLRAGDEALVDEIKNVTINGRSLNFYSFATKYCSHHNPNEYPIYDSYVDKVLCYFRNVDDFSTFRNGDLKNYKMFKRILIEFREFYSLEKYSLKQIDKFLWLFGKKYFPNNYGKTKRKN